jgi:metal-responsive CopG/Arc/MetJ family transcriptional regulator
MTDTTLPDRGRSSEQSYDHIINLRVRDDLLDNVDELVENDVYPNRSEALRELIEAGIDALPEV